MTPEDKGRDEVEEGKKSLEKGEEDMTILNIQNALLTKSLVHISSIHLCYLLSFFAVIYVAIL